MQSLRLRIVALRNEKGSYNPISRHCQTVTIVALRNEKGSYNKQLRAVLIRKIVALRNEKGSYNAFCRARRHGGIVALRNEEIIAFQTAFRPSSASNTRNIASATAISTAVSTIARA